MATSDPQAPLFRNPAGGRQLVDFSGMREGNKCATDLDGFIDYGGRCYLLIELKHASAVMPDGQRIALERLCDDLGLAKPTILIVGRHTTPVGAAIDMAAARVSRYRFAGRWYEPATPTTVRQLRDEFIRRRGG